MSTVTIRDEYTRELIVGMLSVAALGGVTHDDLYGADGDRLAEAITDMFRDRYRIDVTPSAVLLVVAEVTAPN